MDLRPRTRPASVCSSLRIRLSSVAESERFFGSFGAVGAHYVDDFPSESGPFRDGSGASPIGVVGVGEDDHRSGVGFLFRWDRFGICCHWGHQ